MGYVFNRLKSIDWFFILIVPWIVAACLIFPIVGLAMIGGVTSPSLWWTGLVSGAIVCIGIPVSLVYGKHKRKKKSSK